MPTAHEMIAGLARIANDAFGVAVGWHAIFGLALIAAIAGWRPSVRWVSGVLLAPLASVSAVAWIYGNPFNGTIFAILVAALLVLARRAAHRPVARGPAWATIGGAAMLAFAWTYPHFLASPSSWAYLYGAPMGLLPCPTLSAVIGVALLAGGLGMVAWSIVLAATGVFYGIFGAVRLGVTLDLGLILGSVALIVLVARPRR
jgi:hypothetical protein